VPGRRAAALVALAVLASACGSTATTSTPTSPATGPAGVVRIGLAHVLWPLDPARARGRDEITLARALFATPLRTDPATGDLRPGLCSSWSSSRGGRTWRFGCTHAGAIAQELRRARLFSSARVEARGINTLSVSTSEPAPEAPYVLTEVAAAPPGVPGPFRLVSASPARVVLERRGVRLVVRRLEPEKALRLFRAGQLDEAPVPLGDLQASLRDSRLRRDVRIRRLLAVDLVVCGPGGALTRLPALRGVYDDTADRADYQALVPELEAPPAESLAEPRSGARIARAAALAASRARKRIAALPRVAVRFARPADPNLAYGASLLVAAWRDIGLGPFFGAGRPDATFERVVAPYPRRAALQAVVADRSIIPIAWALDARLVSPRLAGWREDELGAVDYARVRSRASSRSR
jgi:hypothetical protein